jgi:hypothetical protein
MEKIERNAKPKKAKKDFNANPNLYGYESMVAIASAVSHIDAKKKNKKVSFNTGLNGQKKSHPNPTSKPTLSLNPKSSSINKPIVSKSANASVKEIKNLNLLDLAALAIDSSNLAIDDINNSQDGTI